MFSVMSVGGRGLGGGGGEADECCTQKRICFPSSEGLYYPRAGRPDGCL